MFYLSISLIRLQSTVYVLFIVIFAISNWLLCSPKSRKLAFRSQPCPPLVLTRRKLGLLLRKPFEEDFQSYFTLSEDSLQTCMHFVCELILMGLSALFFTIWVWKLLWVFVNRVEYLWTKIYTPKVCERAQGLRTLGVCKGRVCVICLCSISLSEYLKSLKYSLNSDAWEKLVIFPVVTLACKGVI